MIKAFLGACFLVASCITVGAQLGQSPLAPPKLPQPLLAKLHGETVAFVKSAEFRKRVENDGAEAVGSDPEAFRQFMLADLKKWADVVKRSGAKFE